MEEVLKDNSKDVNPSSITEKGLNSYKNILKGSSFFGGVQIFNILITLIRGKFVAIILGPDGMGISALFNSVSNTIQRFASLGLNQAIVRDTADETSANHDASIHTAIKLTNLTAILGFIVCSAFCLPLSKLTFGNPSYWWQFIILGIVVGLSIAGAGKLAILQGLHQVKRISRASIIGSSTGLLIGVPLYYLFGTKGIVPAMLAISLAFYIFYSYHLRKSYKINSLKFNWKENKEIIKNLIFLGLVLVAGDIINNLFSYLINLFVRIHGSIDSLGLYQAANSITFQYSGIVFTALAMDYFPRLSKVATDNKKVAMVVNRQSDIVSWLITPAMSILILSTPLIIRILLAESFESIIPLMRWFGLGILLRAFSFPMAYITFAKGNRKVYFLLEGLFANSLTLVLSCLFFHFWGLIGLGYALVTDNFICLIVYFIVNHRLYGYTFSTSSLRNYGVGSLTVIAIFIFSFLDSEALSYSLMSVTTAFSVIWSVFHIRKIIISK